MSNNPSFSSGIPKQGNRISDQPQYFLKPPSIVPTASAYNFTVQLGTRQSLSIERLFAGHEVACKRAPPFKWRSVEIQGLGDWFRN